MHQPPSAHTSIGRNVHNSEKHTQLPRYVFSTVPSIIKSQQYTLSPSCLPTDMPMITPSTTPSIDPTQ